MILKYPTKCYFCKTALAAGTKVDYTSAAKSPTRTTVIACLTCSTGSPTMKTKSKKHGAIKTYKIDSAEV